MPQLNVPTTTCTASRSSGVFCDRASLPEAPFPICLQHAAMLLGYLNGVVPDDSAALVAVAELPPRVLQAKSPLDSLVLPGRGVSLVYYARIGDYIKIGHSNYLWQRMRFYPPDTELLAYELGDRALERKRIKQFRHDLSARMEWFTPSPKLLAHIESLQASQVLAA